MARPPVISNQQILEAARAVFLDHGFTKASTVEIARRAGVSEGSIFNRFPTKDDLFRAAMDDELPPVLTLVERFVGKGDMRGNLVRITVESIRFLNQFLPKVMLSWSERDGSNLGKVCNRPSEVLHSLTAFFKAEKALGRVAGDPQIAARIFMGAMWNFSFMQTVAGHPSLSAEAYARRLVAELWHGIAPDRRAP
jgi:AcrR family transcriptional regulator